MRQQKIKLRTLFSVMGVFLLGLGYSYAQQVQVSGNVSDDAGPLPGVSVFVKGTNNGTATDFDGNYEITADSDAVLSFSFIGYKDKDVSIGGKTTINVKLEEDVSA